MDARLGAVDTPRVFLVTLEGVEGVDALTVLAFMRAETGEAAEAAAAAELVRFGWSDVRALRHGEVVDAAALPADFRAAMDQALKFGSGLIIYEAP
jgi:hypothetical protein